MRRSVRSLAEGRKKYGMLWAPGVVLSGTAVENQTGSLRIGKKTDFADFRVQ